MMKPLITAAVLAGAYAPSFADFQFEHCSHIPLLEEIHAWAWRNHDLKIQVAAVNRLKDLGAIKPRRASSFNRDADQRDYDEEAAAHGVGVAELLGGRHDDF